MRANLIETFVSSCPLVGARVALLEFPFGFVRQSNKLCAFEGVSTEWRRHVHANRIKVTVFVRPAVSAIVSFNERCAHVVLQCNQFHAFECVGSVGGFLPHVRADISLTPAQWAKVEFAGMAALREMIDRWKPKPKD